MWEQNILERIWQREMEGRKKHILYFVSSLKLVFIHGCCTGWIIAVLPDFLLCSVCWASSKTVFPHSEEFILSEVCVWINSFPDFCPLGHLRDGWRGTAVCLQLHHLSYRWCYSRQQPVWQFLCTIMYPARNSPRTGRPRVVGQSLNLNTL